MLEARGECFCGFTGWSHYDQIEINAGQRSAKKRRGLLNWIDAVATSRSRRRGRPSPVFLLD
jgi:hypothetical protein